MAASSSTTSMKRKADPSTRPVKRRRGHATSRSVWNSRDDWDQLVADSQLSTSSISLRRPRPRGMQTLVRCATESAARGFRRMWEDTAGMPAMAGSSAGEIWKESWECVPDHLKVGVRDAVFKNWGGYLNGEILSKVSHSFSMKPEIAGIYSGVCGTTGALPAGSHATRCAIDNIAQTLLAERYRRFHDTRPHVCPIDQRCSYSGDDPSDAKVGSDQP